MCRRFSKRFFTDHPAMKVARESPDHARTIPRQSWARHSACKQSLVLLAHPVLCRQLFSRCWVSSAHNTDISTGTVPEVKNEAGAQCADICNELTTELAEPDSSADVLMDSLPESTESHSESTVGPQALVEPSHCAEDPDLDRPSRQHDANN